MNSKESIVAAVVSESELDCQQSQNGIDHAVEPGMVTSKFSFFNNHWLASMFIVTLFAALCYGLVGLPHYETNDDVVMTAIVSGNAYLDRPDEHLLFSHVFHGLFLKQLYSALPSAPWYGIFQTSLLIISMTVITRLVIGKSKRPLMMAGIAFGALLVTSVRPLVLMQFTTTGAIVACAGALLLMESVERLHLRKRAIACGIGAAMMFALATLIRDESAYLVLIVTTMFVVFRFLPASVRQWRKMFAQLLAVAAALAIVFVFSWMNQRYYQGEWKDYNKINAATSTIREYRCDQVDSPLRHLMYQRIGWTPTDVTLFLNWYGLDKNIYSLEKLTTLSKMMKEHQAATFDIGKAISSIQTLLMEPTLLPLVLPGLLLIPFINRTRVPFASLVLLTIGVIGLCIFIVLWMKLPMRVLVSIIMPLTFFAIRYISVSKIADIFQGNRATTKRFRSTVFGILLLAAIAPAFWLMSQLQVHIKSMAKLERRLNAALQYLSPQSDQFYVCWAANPRVVVSPFTDLAKLYHNFKIIPVGAIGPAPFVMNRLKNSGINNLLSQLDKENVFLISNDEYNRFIRMHAAEKLGKEVVFTSIPVKPKIFKLFKVKYVTPADPEKLKHDLSVAFITEK